MVYDPNREYRPEVQKCRSRLMRYCQGQGLDLGCGKEKISEWAFGIDLSKEESVADFAADLGSGLTLFADEQWDYIFSSHVLEDMKHPTLVLRDWWRLLKFGGHLVLYLPQKGLYPKAGSMVEVAPGEFKPLANADHKQDFEAADILAMLDEFASYEILVNEIRGEDDEYSFELVVKKLGRTPGVVVDSKKPPFTGKKALVIRYGGIGDVIFATPIFRLLKEDGYHVTYNCNPSGKEITENNPYIDEYIVQERDEVKNDGSLNPYWRGLEKYYDRVINLSGSCEDAMLFGEEQEEWGWTDEKRREKVGHLNYYDMALERADMRGRIERPRGELFLSEEEELNAKLMRESFDGRFVIVWSLAGSGPHKTFPFAPHAMHEFVGRHPETLVITVGGYNERLLELANDEGPNFMFRAGRWNLRNTIAAIKYADLVIGSETGALNIAGCFDTPKICMLTHSNHTNLCKYWKNDYSMQSGQECSPCHKLVKDRKSCPIDEKFNLCACATNFTPDQIFSRMKEVHKRWRATQNSTLIYLSGRGERSTRKRGRGGGG